MMGLCLSVVAYVCMGLGVLWPASEYDIVVVKDGAVLRGTVTFNGTVPEPKQFEWRRYPDHMFCGALSDGDGALSKRATVRCVSALQTNNTSGRISQPWRTRRLGSMPSPHNFPVRFDRFPVSRLRKNSQDRAEGGGRIHSMLRSSTRPSTWSKRI